MLNEHKILDFSAFSVLFRTFNINAQNYVIEGSFNKLSLFVTPKGRVFVIFLVTNLNAYRL